VTIINDQSHTNGAAINDIRLRYTNDTANSDVYVDVHCRNNNNSATDTVTISVELIDSTKADKLTGGLWNLTDIIQEPSTGWTYTKQICAKNILAINSNGTGTIRTAASPSDDSIANVGYVNRITNKVTEPLDQRLSLLEGELLEYNEEVLLGYTCGEAPSGFEQGWLYNVPIEEGNPYTKVILSTLQYCPYDSVDTISTIYGVRKDGTRTKVLEIDSTIR
jgi:hypothetical protein